MFDLFSPLTVPLDVMASFCTMGFSPTLESGIDDGI